MGRDEFNMVSKSSGKCISSVELKGSNALTYVLFHGGSRSWESDFKWIIYVPQEIVIEYKQKQGWPSRRVECRFKFVNTRSITDPRSNNGFSGLPPYFLGLFYSLPSSPLVSFFTPCIFSAFVLVFSPLCPLSPWRREGPPWRWVWFPTLQHPHPSRQHLDISVSETHTHRELCGDVRKGGV
jgi:hypothetical protein